MACYMDFTEAIDACAEYLMRVKQSVSVEDTFEILTLAGNYASLSALTEEFRLRLLQDFGKLSEAKCFLEHATKDFVLACLEDEEIETDTSKEVEVSLLKG